MKNKHPESTARDLHPAEQYVADVVSGKIVVGKYVRQAVERHVRDLENGKDRGLWFDRADAEFAIRCFGFFRHSKGKWAGQPFELSPFQHFIVWSIFGWKQSNGRRRFKRVYIELARKNGKSTLLAGIAIILLALDGEAGAEVYSAATKKDQARIVFTEARRMVRSSPELREIISTPKHVLLVEETNSKFEPLSSDADSLDGLNVHGGLIDELHAHKTREVWDVLDTATGSRDQPLLITITTAGFNQDGICYEVRGHCVDLLAGLFQDESYFAYIAAIDETDDWQDENCWIKANPNLGVSNSIDDLRDKCRRAQRTVGARVNFLCKHLDRWTQQAQIWIPIEKWDECAGHVDPAELQNRVCYVGVDLADKLDLNGVAFLFPPLGSERWKLFCRFWMPEDVMEQRCDEGQWHYREWAEKGLLRLTPGNITDYDVVRQELEELLRQFDVRQIGFDPYNATNFATQMTTAGYQMVQVPQRMQHLCEASKEFEAKIVGGKLEHDGSPVMRWMANNVEIEADKNGNIRPIQPRDRRKKVDGIVAAVIGLSRAILADDGPSVYATRGLIVA